MTQPRSTSSPADALGATIANQSSRLSALETVAHRHDPPLSAFVPTGIIVPFAGGVAPDTWLLCFGQTISRTTYSALFSVIGTTYGVGDGSTTFGLPDLRGRVVAGQDNMGGTPASRVTSGSSGIDGLTRGAAGGSETMTHTHSATSQGGDLRTPVGASAGDPGSISYQAAGVLSPPGPANAGSYTLFAGWTFATRGYNHYTPVYGTVSAASNAINMQPTIILNYIIKA